MTWESPPPTRADATVAFSDAESVKRWLDALPRANVDALLAALSSEAEAFNTLALLARERFKALEILRRAALDLCTETRRRYEYKPLPLPQTAAVTLAAVRRLWRALAVGYWHCLAGSLGGEPGFVEHGVRAAHHLLACLRQEQMHGDLARHALVEGFWPLAEVAVCSADLLRGLRQDVEDRMSPDARLSTPFGQYALLRLIALAKPSALARAQYAAATRWLARWRDLVEADESLSVGADGSIALSFSIVLRKIRRRREALAAGSSPESLKLGDLLNSAACDELLSLLSQRLAGSDVAAPAKDAGMSTMPVVCGLENTFHRLGGHGLLDDLQASTASLVSLLRHERFALFGHGGVSSATADVAVENWQVELSWPNRLLLSRPAGQGERLVLHGLLCLVSTSGTYPSLLEIEALTSYEDGHLSVEARYLSGRAEPLLVAVHDRQTGRETRHPALVLQVPPGAPPTQALLPAGLAPRAARFQLLDLSGKPAPFVLQGCVLRGDEYEMWQLVPN